MSYLPVLPGKRADLLETAERRWAAIRDAKPDLGPALDNRLNLEGIARLADGRLVAVNDNQGAVISGPSELIVFHPR